MNWKRAAAVISTFCACVLISAGAARAQTEVQPSPVSGQAGGVIALGDADLQRIVVVDAQARRVLLYTATGGELTLLSVRNIVTDGNAQPKPTAALVEVPKSDAPGQDLPGIPRPERGIRVASSRDKEKSAAAYVVPGTLGEVFDRVREAIRGWEVDSENVTASKSFSPGHSYLRLSRSGDMLEVTIDGYQPGCFLVSLTLRPKR